MDLQELSEEIEDYTQRFSTEDQLEWSLVLQEVAAFVEVRHVDVSDVQGPVCPLAPPSLSLSRLIRCWC